MSMQKKSLNSFNNCSSSNSLPISSYALIFTICGFALIPIFSFINFLSSVNVHPAIYNSCALIFVGRSTKSKSISADVEILIVKHEVQVQAIPNPIINMIENIIFFNKLVFCNINVSNFFACEYQGLPCV
jgi:hypothetical protein